MSVKFKSAAISCFVLLGAYIVAISGTKTHGTSYELKIHGPKGAEEIMNYIQEGEEVTLAPTTETPGGSSEANLTSSEECDRTGTCCFMYTWPGPRYDNGATNFTCPKGPSSEPCKAPFVFTYQNTTRADTVARRPNITELIHFTDENNYRIYCKKGSTCVKYTFYQELGNGRQVWNETRYCGVVQNVNRKSAITKGCYEEKMLSYIKEVCVCTGDRCNTSSQISVPQLFAIIFAAAFSLKMYQLY